MHKQNDDEKAKDLLDKLDIDGGVNDVTEVIEESEEVTVEVEREEPLKTLGKTSSYESTTMAGQSGWKLVKLDNIPSKGIMYPENLEVLIRSVKVSEIRHWSIIDEYDPLDVFEKIAFVLSECSKFNVKGEINAINFKDILEVDKYQMLFKIHRISFPNNENKLLARIKHKKCGNINSIHVTDVNLGGFEYPQELMDWYSPEERCFVVKSEKLNDEWRLYMPTIGATQVFNEYKELCKQRGIQKDEAFDRMAPYLIGNWRIMNADKLLQLRSESIRWNENKFLFIHNATEMLRKISKNKVFGVCEKCKDKINSSIFLGGSFTVKDIFIVPTRLRDLV